MAQTLSPAKTPTHAEQLRGHLPDGSGVQKHSAGDYYPFVVEARETEHGIRWGVFGPDIPRTSLAHSLLTCAEAQNAARDEAARWRRKSNPVLCQIVRAANRFDLAGLIGALRALDSGVAYVEVVFADGSLPVIYWPCDLPALRRKVIYSM